MKAPARACGHKRTLPKFKTFKWIQGSMGEVHPKVPRGRPCQPTIERRAGMKGVVCKACVHSMLTYWAETWAMKAGVFQRLRATERRMLRMICRAMLKDMVESTVIASRVGVHDLEEHLKQKRLRWFGHIAKRDEEVEIKKVFELKIEGQRKRGRLVRWIDW